MPGNIPSKSDENGVAEFIKYQKLCDLDYYSRFSREELETKHADILHLYEILEKGTRVWIALSFALIPVSALILWDFYLLLTNPAYAFKPPFACGSDSSFLYHFSEHIHSLADSFLLGKEKSTSNEKSLLVLLTCRLLIFYRYGITARAFLQSTRCNTPDGRTWARTEHELRRRRKRR